MTTSTNNERKNKRKQRTGAADITVTGVASGARVRTGPAASGIGTGSPRIAAAVYGAAFVDVRARGRTRAHETVRTRRTSAAAHCVCTMSPGVAAAIDGR